MKVITHRAETTYDIIGLSEAQARYLRNLLGMQTMSSKRALGVLDCNMDATFGIFDALCDAISAE